MTAMGEQSRRLGSRATQPRTSGPVIACVEQGAGGLAAAHIAGSLADRLGAELLLATVQQAHPRTPTGEDLTPASRHGRLLLDRAARELDQRAAIRVAIGEPAEKLLALADGEGAGLLVVPATHQSRVRRLLLGSVYLALAGAAPCPVVVVPPGVHEIAATGPIVCGVDGSPPSIGAAGVAAHLAERLDTRLLLVHAANALACAVPGVLGGDGSASGGAEQLSDVARAEAAQMIVTGSRGRGSVASALLGSVASELARTADRPLVIVPADARWPRCAEHGALATRWLRSGGAVLCVAGELDPASAFRLERAAERLFDTADGRLVIDLSEASSLADDAIRSLARLARRASKLGGPLVLVTADYAVRSALERIVPPSTVVTDAIDTALEVIAERSYAQSGEL